MNPLEIIENSETVLDWPPTRCGMFMAKTILENLERAGFIIVPRAATKHMCEADDVVKTAKKWEQRNEQSHAGTVDCRNVSY